MLLVREIGGDTLVRRLVRVFLVTAEEAMQRIDAALRQRAAEPARAAAHQLYASSAQLRLANIAALAESLEAATRKLDIDSSTAIADELRSALAIVKEDLTALLAALPSAPRVAVVDDSEDMRVLLRMILESRFDVVEYQDAGSAILDLRRYPPDLMLIDVLLPDVSGIEALHFLRSDPALKKVPAVAVTALTLPEGESFLDHGFDMHVRKPITDMDALVESLLRLLRKTAAE